MALVHYPVVNKNGEVIAAAITNLDLHDISRAAATFGVKAFYVITPLDDQKALSRQIISHWTDGAGALYNPIRKQALELIRIRDSVPEVIADIAQAEGSQPAVVATTARDNGPAVGFRDLRRRVESGRPHVLLLGTAWGLPQAVLDGADLVLAPIRGITGYNHLSVRSAASVILDRLVGLEE